MKLFNKIILGALLFTSTSALAQGKSGAHGNKKGVVVKTHSSKGAISANAHASENAQIHASDRSILNRPATITTVRKKGNSKYYNKNHGTKKYYYKNGKRYAYKSYGTRRFVRKAA